MQSVVKIYPKFELCLLFKFREFHTLHFQQRIKRIILIYHAARRCIFLMPQAATNGIEWLHSAFVFLRCRLRHWKEKFVKLGKFVVKKIRVICAICGFYDSRNLCLSLFVNSTFASMRKRWCSVAYGENLQLVGVKSFSTNQIIEVSEVFSCPQIAQMDTNSFSDRFFRIAQIVGASMAPAMRDVLFISHRRLRRQ